MLDVAIIVYIFVVLVFTGWFLREAHEMTQPDETGYRPHTDEIARVFWRSMLSVVLWPVVLVWEAARWITDQF